MGYIDDALDEVERATPTTGVNVCIYDDFEDVGDKLEVISNFDTVEEAQNFIDKYEGEEELVMYESEGMVDVGEEKLNKNGTGIQRATRGVNPEKTKAKVLEFVYVSKSECGICKEYDGKTFDVDSPNRPIIPRLESQGDSGSRPYTHPNCKCKWVRPFSYAGITNSETKGSEDYDSVTASLHKFAVKKYGSKFDTLPKSRKHYILMKELMRQLKSDESFDPTSLPIASMLKMTYDAIQPTIALQLARMKHHHTNEVRDLIDTMVGESLTSERKHRIVTEHNLDFTFENLLELTTLALFESLKEEEKIGMDVELEFTDDKEKAVDTVEDHLEEDPEHYSRLKSVFEHDVWDEETNTLVDPSLLEDKKEDKSKSSEGWNVPNSWDDSAPDDDEMKELERVESMDIENGDEVDFGDYGRLYVLNINYGSGWGGRNVDFWVTRDEEDRFDSNAYGSSIDPTNAVRVIEKGSSIDMEDFRNQFSDDGYESKTSEADPCWKGYKQVGMKDKDGRQVPNCVPESKATEDYDDHSCPTCPDKPYNCCCLYCDTDRAEGGIYDCKNCGRTKGNMHYGESKANEWNDPSWAKKPLVCPNCNSIDIVPMTLSFDNSVWGSPYNTCNDCGEKFIEGFESKSTEGGRGSGRKGHQKWMLGAEADPEECPNCMIFTEKKNGNCQICGNSY